MRGNINKFATSALQFTALQHDEIALGDNSLSFQVGTESNVATEIALGGMRAMYLALKTWWETDKLHISTKDDANAAISALDNVTKMVLDRQTTIGAALARLDFTATNLTTSTENVQASESTIRDADMAREFTNYTRDRLLSQLSQAMLAAANQNSSDVLGLLQ